MQPNGESPSPRHRGPRSTAPASQPVEVPATVRRVGPPANVDPGSIVFSPDPGRHPRHAAAPDHHGIGFRSTREVTAEMSPVIYRPAGSGGDREPEKPPRVSIAGPDIPTAASFASETPAKESTPAWIDDDLDDDPEIDEEELAQEAEDHLLDDPTPVVPPAAPTRRKPLQRRRRRILGRADDPVEPEPDPVTEEAEPVEDLPQTESDEAPLAAPAPVDAPPPEAQRTAPPPRSRRVRTLHIGAPPVGPATEPIDEDTAAVEGVGAEPVVDAPLSEPETEVESEVEPVAETEPDAGPEPEPEVAHDPRWRQAAPPRFGTPTRSIPVPESTEETIPDQPDEAESDQVGSDGASELTIDPTAAVDDESATDEAARHVRDSPAISGHVLSTRGRGLSGVAIVAIDTDDEVVGTATTGRRGEFVIENLAEGSYRVGARDTTDGDFIDGWHGGDDADSATALQVDDDETLRDIAVTLVGLVAIDADIDIRRKKVVVDVEVIDRSTGLPGEGTIVIGTDHFRTRLPLAQGCASITLFGSTRDWDQGTIRLAPQVSIEYSGSRHTGPAQRTIRLR